MTIKEWMSANDVSVHFTPLYVDYGESDKYIEHPTLRYKGEVSCNGKWASFDYSGGVLAFLSANARRKLEQGFRMSYRGGNEDLILKDLLSGGKKLYNTPEVKGVVEQLFRASRPDAEGLLNSLMLDSSFEGSFEEWAREYGYDTDSRKAFDVYQACLNNRSKLIGLLGTKLFNELMQCESL